MQDHTFHFAPAKGQGADQNAVKAHNRALLLTHLRKRPGISRAELASLTGLNRSTVSVLIQELLVARLVTEQGVRYGALGRPRTQLFLDSERYALLGATLETDHLAVVVTTLGAQVLQYHREPFRRQEDPAAVLRQLEEVIGRVQRRTERTILGLGLGVAGMVDASQGRLIRADHFGWRNVFLQQPLEEWLGLPVAVERTSHAALLGEQYFGAARDVASALYIDVQARGIGGSIMVQHEVFAGSQHLGGEFGHMSIQYDGPRCTCGSHGCWEVLASEDAALRYAAQDPGLRQEELTFSHLVALAYEGSQAAQRALADMGTFLGIGIANLINAYNPEMVIVGGRVTSAGELVWGPMRRTVAQRALQEAQCSLRIVPAALGEQSAAVGSACLVFRLLLTSPAQIPALTTNGTS